jgi:hypothetical protein
MELKAALDGLETNAATPIIAGDLTQWIDEIRESWERAAELIHLHINELHPKQFKEMVDQDPELLARVDVLKLEDTYIESKCVSLGQAIRRLAEQAPTLEPDEAKAARVALNVVDKAIELTTRVRKQMVAIQTWYIEAFQRDRGAVD